MKEVRVNFEDKEFKFISKVKKKLGKTWKQVIVRGLYK